MRVKLINHRNKITYYYSAHNSFFRKSTGESISDKDINKDGSIKNSILNKHPVIIDKLQYLNKIVDDYIIENKVEPTTEYIKQQLENDIIDYNKKHIGILYFYEQFFNEKKEFFKSDETKSIHSLKDYKSFWNSLIDYELHFDTTITYASIDDEFMANYMRFMRIEHKNTKEKKFKTKGELKNNSLKKRFDSLFAFLRWSLKKNLIKNLPDRPLLSKQKVKKTYLEVDEILKLYDMQFKPTINNVIKDIFVFCCMTGFRFSDLVTLRKTHFFERDGYYFVKKRTEKTSTWVNVPLSDVALEIAKRLDFNLNRCANATFNRIIKEVAKDSELFNYYEEKDSNDVEKWKLITAHVGRHSFITNLIKDNVSINYIMGMTGHTQLQTLNVYIQDREPQDNKILNNVFSIKNK